MARASGQMARQGRRLQLGVAQLDDAPARVGDDPFDRSIEMAAAREATLERRPPGLAPGHGRIGRQPVLDGVQPAAGSEDPPELAEHLSGLRDRAQRERRHRGIDAAVVELDALPHQAGEAHRHVRRGDPRRGQAAGERRRLDGEHRGHISRVVGEAVAASEADLDHVAGDTDQTARPGRAQIASGTDPVGQPRQHVVPPEPHQCAASSSTSSPVPPTAQAKTSSMSSASSWSWIVFDPVAGLPDSVRATWRRS